MNVRAYKHPDIENWRNFRRGIRCTHSSEVGVYGAVDDVWENLDTGELHIVDCKSTSKKGEPSIDVGWSSSYKRQMEIYQWLYRSAGHKISKTGYFLYVNGTDGVMRFDTTMISYDGDDSWVNAADLCLAEEGGPVNGDNCDNCHYFSERLTLQILETAKPSS